VHFPKEAIYVGPCELIGTARRVATAEDHANAHLLAAAPDMYATLRDLLAALPASAATANGKDLERHERLMPFKVAARAALRKAEGGAS
jgi:hypothetical protein